MKPDGKHLDSIRKVHPKMGPSPSGALYGYFEMQAPEGLLRIISSGEHHQQEDGEWEHVSVSLADRCPTWEEMCLVKDLFWMPEECVLQFHPPRSTHINNMPFCLHLWKPLYPIQLPPAITVGVSKKSKRQILKRIMNGK